MESTVLDALKKLYPDSSNQSLDKWIRQGRVLINGKLAKRKNQILESSDQLTLTRKKNFKIPFEILYSDPYIIVVNKPANLLSVASLDPSEKSVHQYLKDFLKSEKIAPLHRLDKEVAGPLIFVKNNSSFDLFKDLFLTRSIHREYRAIVCGHLSKPKGTFESFLKEGKGYVVCSTSEEEGKKAVTHYEVIQESENYSLLKINLETGRKNQIRVHLYENHTPILGDKKYGDVRPGFKGLALYAHSLSFTHPVTGKEMYFESSPPFIFNRAFAYTKLLLRKNRIRN